MASVSLGVTGIVALVRAPRPPAEPAPAAPMASTVIDVTPAGTWNDCMLAVKWNVIVCVAARAAAPEAGSVESRVCVAQLAAPKSAAIPLAHTIQRRKHRADIACPPGNVFLLRILSRAQCAVKSNAAMRLRRYADSLSRQRFAANDLRDALLRAVPPVE